MKLVFSFLTGMLFIIAGLPMNAQSVIKGKVTDEDNNPLVGVNIRAKTTTSGTITGKDGSFNLVINAVPQVLIFSMLGFETKVVTATASPLTIVLKAIPSALDEIVLVGSRNPKRSTIDSPVAVDVIGIQQVKNTLPQTTVNDLLSALVPSFNSNRQSASDGTEHIDPASLRGLGPDQVLVLINGKRRHTTSLVNNQSTFGNGTVGTDLSTIPTAAIARIEVLRDGASAQYGSDAIAGVINLVLKNQLGLEISTTHGQTSRKDGETTNINLNYGHKIGDQGGIMTIALEYNDRKKTNRSQHHNLVIFDQAEFGNFFAYDFSNDNAREIDNQRIAENELTRDDFDFQVGDAAIENVQGFLNMELPTSENAAFYTFGGITVRQGEGFGFRRLPSEIGNVVPELFPFGFQPSLHSKIHDISLSAGYRFLLGKWNIDISNTLGENIFDYTVSNTNNAGLGISSPTRFDAGGHRFFQHVVHTDAQRYYTDVLNGFNLALGAEFRQEQYQIKEGETASYINGGAQSFSGFSPANALNERRQNMAFYADMEIDITENLLFGLAGRYEQYSDFGNTLNGKFTLRYQFAEGYAFRSAVSTGFRAPSLHQRFFNTIATDIVDGVLLNSGIFRNDSALALQLGIPELKEETSRNFSAGFTIRPSNSFFVTIDAYKIDIKDRIILTGSLGNDPFGEPVAELRDLFAAYGASTGRFFTNAINTETFGVDIVADHTARLGQGILKTALSYNFNTNSIADQLNAIPDLFIGQEDVYFGPQEKSLIETNIPKHSSILSLNYTVDRLGFLLRNSYFGEVTRNGFPFGVSQRHSGKIVADITVSYALNKHLQCIAGIHNLFDVFPDEQVYENSYFGVFRYAPVQMGTTGAFYFARLFYTL